MPLNPMTSWDDVSLLTRDRPDASLENQLPNDVLTCYDVI